MEQVVFQQIYHSAHAKKKSLRFHSFRTRGSLEVDFFIEIENKKFLVEVKAGDSIQDSDTSSLHQARKINNVWALSLTEALIKLGL